MRFLYDSDIVKVGKMRSESSVLRKELENFKLSTGRLSTRVNGVSDIWRDDKYILLHTQIGELAKKSKTVIENGESACLNIDKFFTIASENVE